mgnify:CR=1 FL=1
MRTSLVVAALALTFMGGAFVAPVMANPSHAARVQTADGEGVVVAGPEEVLTASVAGEEQRSCRAPRGCP